MFPKLMSVWNSLSQHTTVFGLWEEPRALQAWEGVLDSRTLPEVPRKQVDTPLVVYSAGACLDPGLGYLRLAAAASLIAKVDGTFEVAWRGPVPMSCQTPLRSELLAGAVSLRLANSVWLFSDCKAFVRVAQSLISRKCRFVGLFCGVFGWTQRCYFRGPLDQRSCPLPEPNWCC